MASHARIPASVELLVTVRVLLSAVALVTSMSSE
jgi:hypothetical protein